MSEKTIAYCLQWATQQLSGSPTAALDAQVLLCEALQQSRAYLYAHAEVMVSQTVHAQYVQWIQRRQQQEPVAYIVGHKEFWSLRFVVTPDVLIPRPETELLVETAFDLYPSPADIHVLELGTGSGAIACAIASERPAWHITATDLSEKALAIARQNAIANNIHHIQWVQSDWFSRVPMMQADLILSNPPYLANTDPHLPNLSCEPITALVSGPTGLESLTHLITTAPHYLKSGGWLALEHGCEQGPLLQQQFKAAGYTQIKTVQDVAGLDRITLARFL